MAALGRVVALRRFPVKSMAGEALEEAELGWTGLSGDRQYAFVRTADTSHFPWLTGRQAPEMVLFAAAYAAGQEARVRVTTPAGAAYDVADPALRAELEGHAGQALSLMRLARGCYDAMPVSLLTTAQVDDIAAAAEPPAATLRDPLRFRANLLVESAGPVDERRWAGADLRLGGALLRGAYPIPRCAMIAIDPATAARTPSLLRTVTALFDGTAGLYATVASPGRIRVGDVLEFA